MSNGAPGDALLPGRFNGRRVMRAIGHFVGELATVFIASVIGFFMVLLLAAGAVLACLIGCASALFLLIALAETAWWLHTHDHHAAMTALGYYGYAAGTFALIPVLSTLKEKLTTGQNTITSRL
jgi:CHASE2 domain-containing sensor protein